MVYLLPAVCVFGVPADARSRKADVNSHEVDGACGLHCYFVLVAACGAYVQTDSIYSNPFFRGLEFFIGVLLCSLPIRAGIAKALATWKVFVAEAVLLVAGISIAVRLNIFVGNYMLYDWIVIPLFACMILTLAGLKSPWLQGSAVLRYASAASYAFFLAQAFNTEIENWLFAVCGIQNNVLQIIMSVALCAVMAIALHELVEKPCAKVLKKKL